MQIAYIHGFNSSHRSFNYVHLVLPEHKIFPINYSSHQPLSDSLAEVAKQLPKGKFAVVGHSLGGILAVLSAAAHPEQCTGVVAISAPFGGSKAAILARWLPGHPQILHDLIPASSSIRAIADMKQTTRTLSIISTSGGLATTSEPNDSIVTINSQRALPFGKKVEIKANHFEILTHERIPKLIHEFLFDEHE